MYPENWVLSEDQDRDLPFQISVEAPNGGIWSVNIFPAEQSADELMKEAIEGLQSTYEDVEISESRGDFEGFVSKAIDSYFYCLDFMVVAKIQVLETSKYKIVFLFQAESRDFENQHEVFRAIATSLLNSV